MKISYVILLTACLLIVGCGSTYAITRHFTYQTAYKKGYNIGFQKGQDKVKKDNVVPVNKAVVEAYLTGCEVSLADSLNVLKIPATTTAITTACTDEQPPVPYYNF